MGAWEVLRGRRRLIDDDSALDMYIGVTMMRGDEDEMDCDFDDRIFDEMSLVAIAISLSIILIPQKPLD